MWFGKVNKCYLHSKLKEFCKRRNMFKKEHHNDNRQEKLEKTINKNDPDVSKKEQKAIDQSTD